MQKEGERIFVESLLEFKDYRECAMKYRSCYHGLLAPPIFFDSEFKWRWRMGDTLNAYEIVVINKRLNILYQKVKDECSKKEEASPA